MATRDKKAEVRESYLQTWVDCLTHPTGDLDESVWAPLAEGLADPIIRDALLTILIPGGVEVAWRSIRGEPQAVIGAINRILSDCGGAEPPVAALARADAIMSELIRRAQAGELEASERSARRREIDKWRSRQGQAMTMLAWHCWWRGDSQEALDVATQALALDLTHRLPELIAKLVLAEIWPRWVNENIAWALAVRGEVPPCPPDPVPSG